MIIKRYKSQHPFSEYAPVWDIPFGVDFFDADKTDKIREFLLKKEPELKSNELRHDAGTALGKDSLTSRFGTYNVFDFIPECPELEDLLDFFRKSYVEFITLDGSGGRDLKIVSWYNVLRQGEHVAKHIHCNGSDGYISGNFHLDTYDTATKYVCPYDKNQEFIFKNEKGKLTFFPSYLLHYTDVFEQPGERLTLAFDLRLLYNEEVLETLNARPFMDEGMFINYDNVHTSRYRKYFL